MTRHIVAIGPLPPPLHGFSLATAAMVGLLSENHTVVTSDLSPPEGGSRVWRHPAKAVRVLAALAGLARERGHAGKACYLACDGGFGQLYTLLLVAFARLFAYPTYLHHHSFRYIDRPSITMRAILALAAPDLTHVFLCGMMRDRFTDTYDRRLHAAIVSNAAFVPPQNEDAAIPTRPLTIGMLSNLSRAKGLETFLDLLRQAILHGLPVRAVLAGPATGSADRAMIDAALGEFAGALDYRGRVLGDDKAKFYRDIDVFVFPTTYADETQPIVVFEAKAAGKDVIAYDRACIRKQLDETDLLIPVDGEFTNMAIAWLSEIPSDGSRDRRSREVRQVYEIRHKTARRQATSLIQ